MTRKANDESRFSKFSLWIREYLASSSEITVTNLDFIFDHYNEKKLMLVEEKQHGGALHIGQKITFLFLDQMIWIAAPLVGYDYWGFFIVKFPDGCTMPGPGMDVNGTPATCEDLQEHFSFRKKLFKPFWEKKLIADLLGVAVERFSSERKQLLEWLEDMRNRIRRRK